MLGSSRQPGPDGGDHHDDHDDENDDDSDGELSEANDTEAETERLYDTPQSASRQKNVVLDRDAGGHRLERTPTKLRQGMTVNTAAGQDDDEEDDDDDDALSEPSIASSPPPPVTHVATVADKPPSPSLARLAEAAAADDHQAETRKRKRPSLPIGKPDVHPSPRKRTEVAAAVGDHDGDVAMADEEDGPTNTTSGEQSADEAANGREVEVEPADSADSAEAKAGPRSRVEDDGRTRKQTRSGSKRQKGGRRSAKQEGDEPPHDSAANGVAADEESAHTADDDQPLEVDGAEEAEAAHKNEEECRWRLVSHPTPSGPDSQAVERKRAAYEQLTNIEKRFATFRDRYVPALPSALARLAASIHLKTNYLLGRLYEERLEQLNREEAMLRADNPTHPEYLAMMECVDARRSEKVRIARQELELNLEALGRWAIARRAQIHSQFYQDVRETRERAVAELGQHWYAIQHERRKHANNVPDFGLRYPQNQVQRVRNALSYNKEVSILSGVAKYEGMPAAPEMRGASLQEMDEDLEIMAVGDLLGTLPPLASLSPRRR